jgi:hypothetical protein
VGKRLNGKDAHKEMFPVYDGKSLSRKAFHIWFEKFPQGRTKVSHDVRPGAKVAETIVKRLCAAGFDALVKWWDKCINVAGGCQEINVFFSQVRISHALCFIYICLTCLLTHLVNIC